MSAGSFIAGAIAKDLATLLDLQAKPELLLKTADRHNVSLPWAEHYLKTEIEWKRGGK